MDPDAKPHVVVLPVTEGAPILSFAVALEIFGRHTRGLPEPWYDLRICAPPGPPVRLRPGLLADVPYSYDVLREADTVVVPPLNDVNAEPPADLITAVKDAHRRGARVASLCTGAFVLAATGLLDGRTATTHWKWAEEMARRYPGVRVDPSVLYIDDGDVLTSAGTMAAVDLCLHLVRKDHGAAAANTVARRIVAPAHRGGGQAQYIEGPSSHRSEDGLAPLLDWIRGHLDEPLTVAALAKRANLAERTLIRQFNTATGTTPIKWLTEQRVLRARELLESSALSIDQIARASGLGGPANFRRHFTAAVGVAPSSYRRTFRTAAG